MTDQENEPITKTQVEIADRLEFLPTHTGKHFIHYEGYIFDLAGTLLEDYNGGFWQFYTLSNGGFYMALDEDTPMRMTNALNYFDDTLTPDAAGIILNLIAISDFSIRNQDSDFGEKYHLLLDYARSHPEADKIFRAID